MAKKTRKKSTALAKVTPPINETLSLASPRDVMAFGKVLKGFIKDNNLSVKIGKSDYSMVDGWKFAGLQFGLTAIPAKPIPKHLPGQYITILYSNCDFITKDKKKYTKEVPIFAGFVEHVLILEEVRKRNKISKEFTKPYFAYECDCSVEKLSDHSKVTRGTGFCSNLELEKVGFDEYSVISMSETRSIGKSYRNLLGFVMKAAGVEPTPAEEMSQDGKFENAPPAPVVQPESKLPEISQQQFTSLMKRVVKEGQEPFDLAKKHYNLTEDQIKSLTIALDARQQQAIPV